MLLGLYTHYIPNDGTTPGGACAFASTATWASYDAINRPTYYLYGGSSLDDIKQLANQASATTGYAGNHPGSIAVWLPKVVVGAQLVSNLATANDFMDGQLGYDLANLPVTAAIHDRLLGKGVDYVSPPVDPEDPLPDAEDVQEPSLVLTNGYNPKNITAKVVNHAVLVQGMDWDDGASALAKAYVIDPNIQPDSDGYSYFVLGTDWPRFVESLVTTTDGGQGLVTVAGIINPPSGLTALTGPGWLDTTISICDQPNT